MADITDTTPPPGTAAVAMPPPVTSAGISATDVINAALAVKQNAADSVAQLDSAFGAAQGAAGSGAAAALAKGKAQVDINNVVETAAIKAKTDSAGAAAAFGTNPDASSFVISKMGQEILAGQLDISKRTAALQKEADTSFFDDPLSWLGAQISMPFDSAALDIATTGVNQKISAIAKLQALTLDQFKINETVDNAAGTTLLAAKNAFALAAAKQEAAGSALQMAQLGIQKINMRQSLTMDQFTAMNNANDAVVKAQQFDMQKSTFVVAQETAKRSAILGDLQIKAAQNDQAAKDELTARLSQAAITLGMKPMTYDMWHALPNNSPLKSVFTGMIESGDADMGRVASNPAVFAARADLIPTKFPPGMELVRQDINAKRNAAYAGNELLWKSYTPAVAQAKLNDALAADYSKELKAIPDTGSIFSPPPLAKVASIPILQDNPIIKLMTPLTGNIAYATNANDILTHAALLVDKYGMDPREAAAKVAQIYTAIIMDNNSRMQYNRAGLPGLSTATTGFNTVVGTGNLLLGRSAAVDMSNASAVYNLLMRRSVNSRVQKSMYDANTSGAAMLVP